MSMNSTVPLIKHVMQYTSHMFIDTTLHQFLSIIMRDNFEIKSLTFGWQIAKGRKSAMFCSWLVVCDEKQ